MSGKRDYYRYELKDGPRVVYIGITNDPARREQEHRSEGKVFSSMNVIRAAVTETTAREWEEKRLEAYRSNHAGKNPKLQQMTWESSQAGYPCVLSEGNLVAPAAPAAP